MNFLLLLLPDPCKVSARGTSFLDQLVPGLQRSFEDKQERFVSKFLLEMEQIVPRLVSW